MKTFEVVTPIDTNKVKAHQVLIHTNGCLIFWDEENQTIAAYSPENWCQVSLATGETE